MSQLVDPSEIESLVGVKRSPWVHWGRMDTKDANFYILHSQECVDTCGDLRECPYSRALDRGVPVHRWPEDKAVPLGIAPIGLVPIH